MRWTALLVVIAGLAGCDTPAERPAPVAPRVARPPSGPCAWSDEETVDAADAYGKVVSSWTVCGAADDYKEYAKKEVKLPEGEPLDPETLRVALAKFWDMLGIGRVEAVAHPSANGVDIEFHCEMRRVVRAFEYEGVTSLSAKDVEEATWKVGDRFNPHYFRRTLDGLEKDYRVAGFERTRVEPQVTPDGPDGVRVKVKVTEGERSTVGTVALIGVAPAFEAEVRAAKELVVGATIEPSWSLFAKARVATIYRNRGYMGVQVTAERDESSPTARYPTRVTVVEGPLYKYRKIEIKASDPKVIPELRKQLRIRVGDVFVADKANEDLDRMRSVLTARKKNEDITAVETKDDAPSLGVDITITVGVK